VTLYVLTGNTIADRKAKVTSLQAQVAQAQAQAARLGPYTQFAKLAQTRAETIRQIAATRFDWHAALSDLSKVVPANTSLQSLVASVVPGAAAGGGASGAAGGLRGSLPGPAFELAGCTKTQDDVARLMSRLRLINGVTRVTLSDSQKQDASQTGASVTAAGTGASAASGCGGGTPSFHLVIFFKPIAGAGPNGPSALVPQQVSNATTAPGGSR
jgi:Tfp pilus assembly protein PilN